MLTPFSQILAPPQLQEPYFDNYLAITDDITQIENIKPEMIMDGFLMVLILKGHATGMLNGQETQIQAGQLFICAPNMLMTHIMISLDLQMRAFYISIKYVEQYLMENHHDWNLRFLLAEERVFTIDTNTQEVICLYYDLFQHRPMAGIAPLFHALVCEITTLLGKLLAENSSDETNSLSAQMHFKRFNMLLENSPRKNYPVQYWAEQLHITPKYLSAICKKISGYNASFLINQAVMQDANLLLRDHTLNIKQIAQKLGFTNQSHFGVFYHRHAGISPQEAR